MKKRYALGLLVAVIAICIVVAISVFIGIRRRSSPSGPTSDEMAKQLLEFDRNGDSQLSNDEVPERMQGLFARGDVNQDGLLTQGELRKLAEAQYEAARRASERR